jgi:DNA-binding XRE family transcriptional regulator
VIASIPFLDLKWHDLIYDNDIMDHQDWSTVVLKRHKPSHGNPAQSFYRKIEEDNVLPVNRKRLDAETLQSLIRKRIELKLTQEKADQVCNFPKHTFKEIESYRALPTNTQQSAIQRHFGVQLKVNTISI